MWMADGHTGGCVVRIELRDASAQRLHSPSCCGNISGGSISCCRQFLLKPDLPSITGTSSSVGTIRAQRLKSLSNASIEWSAERDSYFKSLVGVK